MVEKGKSYSRASASNEGSRRFHNHATGKASTRTRCLNSVFVFNVKELKQEKAEQKAIVRAFSVIVISL